MSHVQARYADGKIVVSVHANSHSDHQRLRAAVREVGGGRWRLRSEAFFFSASIDVCHRLRKVLGDGLQIKKSLAEWYIAAQAEAEEQTARNLDLDAELTRSGAAPELYDSLRPDQRAAVAAIARASALLVASHPGTGKTREIIGGLIEAGIEGPILIAAPRLATKRVWERELRAFTPWPVYLARGTRAQREVAITEFEENSMPTRVLVIVHEMLRVSRRAPGEAETKSAARKRGRITTTAYPRLFGRRWAVVVIDESHRLFGSLTVARSNLAGEGAMKLSADRRYAVTGTPFGSAGRVYGMFGTLHWLWPREYTSFWRWAEQNFYVGATEFRKRGGGGATGTARTIGALRTGDEETFLASLGPRVLRHTKDQVLPWLPGKQFITVECEMPPAQLRQYKELTEFAEISTPGGPIVANGSLAELTRAKQVANGELTRTAAGWVSFTGVSGKIDALIEHLANREITVAGQGLKVVVASQFVEMLRAVTARLRAKNIEFYYLDGRTPDLVRDEEIDAFQRPGGRRVFVIQSRSGGVAVTLDAADELHRLDITDDPSEDEQLEDRLHRGTRNTDGNWNTHQVRVYDYQTLGTIDTIRAQRSEGRRYDQHRVLDARRGLAYVRTLISYREEEMT